MRLAFHGAAREVTGSCHQIECAGRSFLVDYGLFQGGADARRRNEAPPAFEPRAQAAVVVTHAHIDHSGLLPRLTSAGFRGPILATSATCDLLHVMLPDAAYVQERESGGGRTPPLYNMAQAQAALRQLRRLEYDELREILPGVRLCLREAGHILGSAIVELWLEEGARKRKLVLSGDIGAKGRPIVRDPARIEEADVLVVESTYGNRLHKSMAATEDEFVDVITRTIVAGHGNIVMPAFAVGRTQEILYVMADLVRRGRLPAGLIVYVDSPMAARATALLWRHRGIVDRDTVALVDPQPGESSGELDVRFTESVEESKRLNDVSHGALIISASGMCDAGRIRYHLKHNLPRAECAVVFTGFQAVGTLGRRLVDGATTVRILGVDVPVRARISTIGGLSAHADRDGLLEWLQGFRRAPQRTYVVHGEAQTVLSFADFIRGRLGWNAEAPVAGQVCTFDA
jgi:metallo-beta-lactamase family protein